MSHSLVQMSLSASSTIAQGGGDAYGVFGFSGVTIGVLATILFGLIVVAIITIVADLHDPSRKMHDQPAITTRSVVRKKLVGLASIVAVNIFLILLLLTWWTAPNDWNGGGGLNGIGIFTGSLVALVAAIWLTISAVIVIFKR